MFNFNTGPHIIPGIHNYCDRWCERCPLAERCAIYDGGQDLDKVDFVKQLSETFASIRVDLEKKIEELGIEMPSDEEMEEIMQKEDEIDALAEQNDVAKASLHYVEICKKWLDERKTDLVDFADDLADQQELGILTYEQIDKMLNDLNECFEVIQWYMFFINVKFMRALSSKLHEQEEDDEDDDFPKDSDGSAKVGIIAAETSLAAWVRMQEILPQYEDSILTMLAVLQKCIRLADAEFPDARKFVRPGFDEVV